MTESLQPTSATLSAKVIRKCPTHPTCPLTCKQRQVEDLGEIASFAPTLPNPNVGLVTGQPPTPTLLDRVGQWLEHITHRGEAP